MTDSENNDDVAEEVQLIPLAEFLESYPPNRIVQVSNLGRYDGRLGTERLLTPDIELHCENDACNGIRYFRCESTGTALSTESFKYQFLTYRCRNCQRTTKIFAVAAHLAENEKDGEILKFGEWPPFGPPTPARVVKLIGPDRELFLTGRRSENQGMGIGAFVYYRRVVENQKDRIFDEIIRVSEKLGATPESIEELKSAKKETQFSKAVESVKHAIPQSLLINGHNPLSLLHTALSEGLHAQTDEECLELATSIRIVLNELAERLGQALKDEAELNAAVSRLLGNKPKSNGS